ncbi:MAG TPA: hypothetical protein VGN17_19045 [Bryobacteraceae bacterium]|jgi:hypothetical protein
MRPSALLPVALLAGICPLWAQAPGPPRGGPASAKRAASFDPTGYWVAQITEDWRYRISAAPKGDPGGIPVNAAGRRVAAGWDPDKDIASGDACKAYGVGGILRMPGRLHITWDGEDVLKMEADSGSQTRWFSFAQPRGKAGDSQGVSMASWDRLRPAISGFQLGGGASVGGSLKVVTTQAKPGYLARNGIPYGATATFTEFYDLFQVPGGDTLLVASVEVTDPEFLTTPYWYSVHFMKQPDANGWTPGPCSVK